MPTRKPIQPQLTVGDKIIQVGAADWGPFSDFIEAVAKSDLPLPTLNTDGMRDKITAIQAGASTTGSIDMADIMGLLFEFLSTNLPTVCAWIGKQRDVLGPLLAATTNLTPEEAGSLTAGQVMRVARASFQAIVDDGVFAEAAGFFGALVGLNPGLPTSNPPAVPVDSAPSVAA